MHFDQMPLEHSFLFESLATNAALERAHLGVNQNMAPQLRRAMEGSVTALPGASVRLPVGRVIRMCLQVLSDGQQRACFFLACVACEGHLKTEDGHHS